MKKGLLIDDRALCGWKSVLEKVVIKNSLDELEYATDSESALNKIEQEKYDIIFLDLRLTEEDHYKSNIKDFSGYKILKKIKNGFLNLNFSTPIILLTASNKIWYIDELKELGVNAFYIKEHPNLSRNSNFSKENISNLRNEYEKLLKLSQRQHDVWEQCKTIIEEINKHDYFQKGNKKYENVKKRIVDKVKLGYSYLFKKESLLEKEVLKSHNEALSFIIFFSILEEISKGYTIIEKTWDKLSYKRIGNWVFRNGVYFIEALKGGTYKINYNSKNQKKDDISEDSRYGDGVINLSEQINALIYAYFSPEEIEKLNLIESFRDINSYRNKMDYIHSSVKYIFKEKINNIDKSFDYNIKILEFINIILKKKLK